MTRKAFLYSFALGALVLLISMGIFFGLQYRQTMDETYAALQGEASYAVNGLKVGGIEYLKSLENINRITWISHDGQVLYDSAYPDLTADQSGFKEVMQALETGSGQGIRQSSSGGVQTMYYAVLCEDGTVLRLSRPLSAVRYAFLAVSPMLWAIVLVLLISAFMAFYIANNIARPINEMNLDDLPNASAYPELQPLVGRIQEQQETIRHQEREREQLRRESLEKETAERERQAEEREEQVRERERMRREFTANVSHELKTPLTSISGFAELMNSGLCDEKKMTEFAGDIYRESQRLIALVNDILHLSELDELDERNGLERQNAADSFSGQDWPERQRGGNAAAAVGEAQDLNQKEIIGTWREPPEEVDLFRIACSTAERLMPMARKNRISLQVTGSASFVYGWARILEEIVYNLCDNAIKYNREGGSVTVLVETGESGSGPWNSVKNETEDAALNTSYAVETGKYVLLSVEDTGIGIPLDEQERIFERFYRVDKSHSRQIGGTGLGLSIVKHGAQLHGASIHVDSAPGEGTRISLRFPAVRNE